MGSLVAQVGEDGNLITQTTSGDSLTASTSSSSNTVDSDTFLTLLVAEMQNQDPLEPTSNTEWVAQYAQFTQVETMNEMSESMDLLRANSLVGKDVIMKVTSASTGDVTYARGTVEYTQVENGKAILVIDGNQYSLSDLDSVISDEYSEAYDLYTEFAANINALPSVKYADKTYADKITSLYNQYNFEMDDYQKSFMTTYASDELSTLSSWVTAMANLGVKFDTEKAAETSLDDILASFNSQMDTINKKLELLSQQVDAQTTSQQESSGNLQSQIEQAVASAVAATTTTVSTADTQVSDEAIEQLVADTAETVVDQTESADTVGEEANESQASETDSESTVTGNEDTVEESVEETV